MKKEYIFILLIIVMLYILYLIIWHKYKEYKINIHIDNLTTSNQYEKNKLVNKKDILKYLATNAYKDRVLKETRWLLNKWEEVVIITKKENSYNKIKLIETKATVWKYYENNFEKWKEFLLTKEKSIN